MSTPTLNGCRHSVPCGVSHGGIYMEQPEGFEVEGDMVCKPVQIKSGATCLESTNSGVSQVDWLYPNVLGSVRVHQQNNRNNSGNVGGRLHHFRRKYRLHQRFKSDI